MENPLTTMFSIPLDTFFGCECGAKGKGPYELDRHMVEHLEAGTDITVRLEQPITEITFSVSAV